MRGVNYRVLPGSGALSRTADAEQSWSLAHPVLTGGFRLALSGSSTEHHQPITQVGASNTIF